MGLSLFFSVSVTSFQSAALRKGGTFFLAVLPNRKVDSGASTTVAPTAAQTAKGFSS